MSSTRHPTLGRVGSRVIQMVLDTPLLLARLRAFRSQTGFKRSCFQMSRNFEVELKQNLTFNKIDNLSKIYCLNFTTPINNQSSCFTFFLNKM
jgi:hypothetical protein